MIYYDVTKMDGARGRSGLTRVSTRLREELGDRVTSVAWHGRRRNFHRAGGSGVIEFSPSDWLLTVELFSGDERPGFREFVAHHPCRLAAVFHDAIPLRLPHITWPQSVQRHPDYLKLLAAFDRVWAVSEASRADLAGFWRWQGVTPPAPVGVIELGADFDGAARRPATEPDGNRPLLLGVGIIEPRKNQGLLLDVAEELWREGLDFELHLVGRVNPHFGPPLERRLRRLAARESRLQYHAAAGDARLRELYARARAVVLPTLAEGCGLPLLEALWCGVPCLASDLPVLRENAAGGGCLLAKVDDRADWSAQVRSVLLDAARVARLRAEAAARPLPRWADTARTLLQGLG